MIFWNAFIGMWCYNYQHPKNYVHDKLIWLAIKYILTCTWHKYSAYWLPKIYLYNHRVLQT